MKANHIDIKDLLPKNQSIIIAPLCWGLGHATRCIPIINEAISQGNKVTIASDGEALALLKGEFPNLYFCELQGYNVRYPYKSIFLNIFLQYFKILKAYISEKTKMAKLVKSVNANMIISDNRYGCFSSMTTNVFITHQLSIHSGSSLVKYFATKVNQFLISSFDQIWVPDDEDHSLAGALSETKSKRIASKVRYVGPLSRIKIDEEREINFEKSNILVLLSGPEPQRTYLESSIFQVIKNTSFKYLIMRGSKTKATNDYDLHPNIQVIDFANTLDVQTAIQHSSMIITRSGYTTIMDLVDYNGQIIMCPTPGQTEQELLAEHHSKKENYTMVMQYAIKTKLLLLIEHKIGK